MGFSGLFKGHGIHIQIEETVQNSSILLTCYGVPPEGPEFEFLHGCERAQFDFVTRDHALRFAKRTAIALGITAGAYGAGFDALQVAPLPPPAEPAPQVEPPPAEPTTDGNTES